MITVVHELIHSKQIHCKKAKPSMDLIVHLVKPVHT